MDSLPNQSEPDYDLWRLGASRCAFRGPEPLLDRPFAAVLGGSETYGRFVERPFPALLGDWQDLPVANLSTMQAGLTWLQAEPALLEIASRARVTVLPILGAANMSNPMYSVHPRRNDRFIAAHEPLRALYPQVDFAEFHFTGHLMRTLETVDPWAFDMLVETIRATWVKNMQRLLAALPANTVLLWMSARSADSVARGSAACDPVFVDRDLLNALDGAHARLVEVVASPAAAYEGTGDMRFAPTEADAARILPGPLFHAEVAEALAAVVASAQKKRRAGNADAPPSDQCRIRASR